MRLRSFAALSIAALSVIALAGCSGSSDGGEASASAAADAADLCAAATASGDVSDSITVSGEVGSEPTISFDTPLDVTELERTVTTVGDGAQPEDGDYITYALSIYDASTGELLEAAGYGDDVLPPIPVAVGSGVDAYFGCATAGSRIVLTIPSSSTDVASDVYVLDVLDVTPEAEWCVVADADAEMPTVTWDDSGVPTITVPDSDAPSGVVVDVLEEGDGDVVESGDTVTVNYTGVTWSDGAVFDSSWESGSTATFTTTGVVTGFQRALEGQKVGSKVLVSMSPECGYGEASTSNTSSLAGETLVFVIEIVSDDTAAG